jgi:hypothetical protein
VNGCEVLRSHPFGWQEENLGSAVFGMRSVRGLVEPFVLIEVVSIFHSDPQEAGCTNGVVIADIVAMRVDVDEVVRVNEVRLDEELLEVYDIVSP